MLAFPVVQTSSLVYERVQMEGAAKKDDRGNDTHELSRPDSAPYGEHS